MPVKPPKTWLMTGLLGLSLYAVRSLLFQVFGGLERCPNIDSDKFRGLEDAIAKRK
jgi:hypothetical protein